MQPIRLQWKLPNSAFAATATKEPGDPRETVPDSFPKRRAFVSPREVAATSAEDHTRKGASGEGGTIGMSTATKLVLGAMGRLRPKPAHGTGLSRIALPPPQKEGGMPLLDALSRRRSTRSFLADELPLTLLSGLLWAANGVNRNDGGRTAPSALDAHEIDVFVARPDGAYLYDAATNALELVAPADVRRVTGYQDFVDDAPLDLVYVADHRRMTMMPVGERVKYAAAAAGAICENVYLFAAANDLAAVIRAWIDRNAIANALGLSHDQEVLLSQTVGYPRTGGPA